MLLFDTHAHYYDEKFKQLEGGADALLRELFSSGVGAIVNAGTGTADSLEAVELSERFEGCYAAVGVHPENCGDEADVGSAIARLRELARRPKVVAIGEIGLDYHWAQNPPRELQKEYFAAQMDLARELGLPAVIHDRDAHGDVFDVLARYPDVRAVLHCYSGSPETARQYALNPNRYFGFGGVITYPNAVKTVESASLLPLNRILSETDCPYLSPVPYRHKLNHSGYMIKTVGKLAEIKGLPAEELAKILYDNALRFYGIDR